VAPTGWGALAPADQPGVIPLQPLGLGQIYEGAFATVRRSWRAIGVFAGVTSALVFAVSLAGWLIMRTSTQQLVDVFDAIAALGPNQTPTTQQTSDLLHAGMRMSVVGLVMTAFLGLANVVVTSAVTVIVGRAVLGQSISASRLWRQLRPLLVGLIGLTVLIWLGVVGGLLLCLVPGVIFGIYWVVAVPALVLERCGPVTAMRRSWHLVAGSWWRVCGIFLLTYLIVGLVAGVVTAPLQVVMTIGSLDQFSAVGQSPTTLQFLPTTGAAAFTTALAQAMTTLIAVPLLASVMSLLYIDLRIRKENLATALSAAARTPED